MAKEYRKSGRQLIHQVQRNEITRYSWGDTSDIIAAILRVCNNDGLKEQVWQFAQQFKGHSPQDQYKKLEKLWRFCRFEIEYEKDPDGYQFIKHPGRTFWDNESGQGADCKSLSIFIYYICRCIGVPCFLRFTSYSDGYEWQNGRQVYVGKIITHVYPVAVLPGYGTVPVDAVFDQFDAEEDYTYKLDKRTKIFHEMSKIVEITGFNIGAKAPTNRSTITETAEGIKQRAKLVSAPAYVDTANLSEGEMLALLMLDRYKMLMQFYPEAPAYRKGYEMIRQAIEKGLHTGIGISYFGSLFDAETAAAADVIIRAKNSTAPASRWTTWEGKARTPGQSISGIGDPTIPTQNCEQLFPIYPIPPGQNEMAWVTFQGGRQNDCKKENDWRKLLNDHLIKMANHPLYEFINGAQENKIRPIASWKAGMHQGFITKLALESKINRNLIRTWTENGVMWNNTKGGIGPATGTETIQGLVDGSAAGIGFIPLAVLPLIPIVLGATLLQARLFFQVVKGKPFAQALKEHITNVIGVFESPEFQAAFNDFKKEGSTSTETETENPPSPFPDQQNWFEQNWPLVVGGGVGLLLYANKK